MLDLRGKKCGKLLAMSPTDKRAGTKILWDCVCECGRHRLVSSRVFNKHTRLACGDCQKIGRPRTRGGLSNTQEYGAWQTSGWPDFQEFLRVMGLCPEGCKLGRLDESKPHGPGNTAWVPKYSHLGKRHGQLEVQSVVRKGGRVYYRCLCDCGRPFDKRVSNAFSEQSHCGHPSHSTTHGHAIGQGSPTYISWGRMMTRCYNPNSARFKNYGARGVQVTCRWHKFENFLADMGPRPEGKTLGRFLDRGNYSSRTCAWMTSAEQGLNVRNNNALKNWALRATVLRKPPVSVELEQIAVA